MKKIELLESVTSDRKKDDFKHNVRIIDQKLLMVRKFIFKT